MYEVLECTVNQGYTWRVISFMRKDELSFNSSLGPSEHFAVDHNFTSWIICNSFIYLWGTLHDQQKPVLRERWWNSVKPSTLWENTRCCPSLSLETPEQILLIWNTWNLYTICRRISKTVDILSRRAKEMVKLMTPLASALSWTWIDTRWVREIWFIKVAKSSQSLLRSPKIDTAERIVIRL